MAVVARETRRGTTLLELLIYIAIFVIIIGSVVGILLAILRIQNSSTSAREVTEQGRFVLQTIQREVRDASIIDVATNTPVSVLVLRNSDVSRDYVAFYASGTAIWMDAGTSDPVTRTISTTTARLTNENVVIDSDSLVFRRIHNPPAKDAVQVSFTLSFNTTNPQSFFSKAFKTTIARVSAAVFDSDIIPSQDNYYSVGLGAPSRWKNINISNLLNVGQLAADPAGQNGSIYYNTASNTFRGYANSAWANLGNQWGINGNNIYYLTGKVGIGTTTPGPILTILTANTLSNAIGWGSSSVSNILGADQGGKIELGASNNQLNPITGGTPYFDFHYGNGLSQDYNVRIINDDDKRLSFQNANGTPFSISGSNVGIGTSTPGQILTISDAGPLIGIYESDQNNKPWFVGESNTQFFISEDTAVNSQRHLVINPGGYVSIGTTTQSHALTVVPLPGMIGAIRVMASTSPANSIILAPHLDNGSFNPLSKDGDTGIIFDSGVIDGGSLVIGPWSNTVKGIRITADGTVGIGITFPGTFKLYVNGSLKVNSATTEKITNTAWTIPSDARLKNVVSDYNYGLSQILKINPVWYSYKADNALHINDPGKHVGVLAQEIQKVIPEAVTEGPDGYLRFTSDAVMWTMVNSIKELKAENDSLKSRIENLEKR